MAEADLHCVAFPRLDPARIATIERCGGSSPRTFRDGDVLVQAGARDFAFFVVTSGEVAVLDDAETPKTLAVLGPGEFTGDVAHLTGEPSLVSVVARGDVQAQQVSPEGVREILNRFPDLADLLLQAFIARRHLLRESGRFTGLRVIGSRYSRDTHRIRAFLTHNRMPFTWFDLEEDPGVAQLMRRFGVSEADTPVVAWGSKLLLRNPSDQELAEALGLRRGVEQTVHDLVVVGAGPAGLAAAVYAASEGLDTVVLERAVPGGQAGRSMRIENYLGFPTGVTGAELAERAVVQAGKFGAQLSVATPVVGLDFDHDYAQLRLDDGELVTAKCLIIATGADYRKLDAEGCEQFEGSGVYYAATLSEAPLCRGAEVVIVGGGNSAGQAAVFLAGIAHKVDLVIRGDDLHADMSSYLARRIEQTPAIEVLLHSVVQRMTGDTHLRAVEIADRRTGEVRVVETPAVFSFIGAVPRTDWLPPEIERDEKGFVRTGPALATSPHWTPRRQPSLLETSRPAVFAVGDVRSGSVRRVASAVGEGAMAVMFVHEVLKTR